MGAMRWMLGALMLCAGCAAKPARTVAVPPQPYCTRTLGMAECFADPSSLPDHPEQWVDTPVRPPVPAEPWWEKVADHWK